MLEEIGISKDVMSYITYDSTGDAITAALGGHVEFVISKPAAASGVCDSRFLILWRWLTRNATPATWQMPLH